MADDAKGKAEELTEQAKQKAKDAADASDGVSGNTGDGESVDAAGGPVADGFAGGNTPDAGS